ncbi:hypothetical protein D3C77_577210 [compost metagenome]
MGGINQILDIFYLIVKLYMELVEMPKVVGLVFPDHQETYIQVEIHFLIQPRLPGQLSKQILRWV